MKPTAKAEAPKSFSGKNATASTIEEWRLSVSVYLMGSGVDPKSFLATSHIGGALEGKAYQWFTRVVLPEVENLYPARKPYCASPWPLSRIAEGLKSRFVTDTSHREAQAELDGLTQHPSNGEYIPVEEIYEKIIELAPRCYQCTDFDQRRAFFNAMDRAIVKELNRAHKPEMPGVTLEIM